MCRSKGKMLVHTIGSRRSPGGNGRTRYTIFMSTGLTRPAKSARMRTARVSMPATAWGTRTGAARRRSGNPVPAGRPRQLDRVRPPLQPRSSGQPRCAHSALRVRLLQLLRPAVSIQVAGAQSGGQRPGHGLEDGPRRLKAHELRARNLREGGGLHEAPRMPDISDPGRGGSGNG